MMRPITRLATLAFASTFFTTPGAKAHGLGPDRAVIRLAGDTAHLVATPSIRTMPFIDRNRDGNVSSGELGQFKNAVLHRYGQQFLSVTPLTDGGAPDRAPRQRDFFQDVRLPHQHGDAPVTYVRVERRWKLPSLDTARLRVQWTGAHRSTPTKITLLRTTIGTTPTEQRPLSRPQTAEFLRSSPRHDFSLERPKPPESAAGKDEREHRPPPGISPSFRQFGLLLSALLMALGLANWKSR